MKSKIIIAVIIGLICFVLVYVMSIQIRTVEKTDLTSIKTMRETDLKNEITNWKSKFEEVSDKYTELILKIEEYKQSIENNQEAKDLVYKEINQSKMLLGKTSVSGPGVIVTLVDTEEAEMDDYYMLKLVNELRLAGAEAISINGERVIARSYIKMTTDFIIINEQRTASPYTIYAIGDPTYLESGLIIKDGYIDKIKKYGVEATVEKVDSVVIPPYGPEIKLRYAI